MALVSNDDGTTFKCSGLGGSGEDFQRRIALLLLKRATLAGEPFKLAFEIKTAGKFDDVALYRAQSDVWWLVQAKHAEAAKQLDSEALFPKTDKDRRTANFSIFKYFESFLYVRDYWPHGGSKMLFVLFTNNGLAETVSSEKAPEMDKMFVFGSGGEHRRLKPDDATKQSLVDYGNSEFSKIAEGINHLFTKGEMREILKNYKTPLSEILVARNGKVYFSDKFSENHSDPRIVQLYNWLKDKLDIAKVSVTKTKQMSEFFTGRSRILLLPSQASSETVDEFFESFILSVKQPNHRQIKKTWHAHI